MIDSSDAVWQRHYFPPSRQFWELKVLNTICEQYKTSLRSAETAGVNILPTLRVALKLSVLSHVMSKAFVVPRDAVPDLFDKLQDPRFRGKRPQGHVCPRAANKVLKMMLLPLMKVLVTKILSGLQDLFRSNLSNTVTLWENMFSIVFLCLVVIGRNQDSLFQRAEAGRLNGDPSFNQDNATVVAREMSFELALLVIGMFHERFGTRSKRKRLNPLATDCRKDSSTSSTFAARIWSETKTYG